MVQHNQSNIKYIPVIFYVIIINFTKEGITMLKFLAKVAEKYAKTTNTACGLLWVWHQPKMPKSMIQK